MRHAPALSLRDTYTLIKARQATTITAESAELAEKYKKLCVLCVERVFGWY